MTDRGGLSAALAHPVTAEHPAATFPTQPAGGLAAALGPGFGAEVSRRLR